MDEATHHCAAQLLEVVPLMMRAIRAQVRSHSGSEMSVPQFRALAFLGRNESAMLGEVADFLGLTLPAASKLIDGLVATGLAARRMDPEDRRKVMLSLTAAGRRKYGGLLKFTGDFLGERVARLTQRQRAGISAAMRALQSVFADAPPETGSGRPKKKP